MELKNVENPIDSAGALKRTLSNLFYGWGYNFYRKENQLRADDLLIRGKISEDLGKARGSLGALESTYRREHLPAPTREHPFPSSEAVRVAKIFTQVGQKLEAFEIKVRTASVPEMDRIHQRHLQERATLEALTEIDLKLVGLVLDVLKKIIDTPATSTLDDTSAATEQFLKSLIGDCDALNGSWTQREQVLSSLIT